MGSAREPNEVHGSPTRKIKVLKEQANAGAHYAQLLIMIAIDLTDADNNDLYRTLLPSRADSTSGPSSKGDRKADPKIVPTPRLLLFRPVMNPTTVGAGVGRMQARAGASAIGTGGHEETTNRT